MKYSLQRNICANSPIIYGFIWSIATLAAGIIFSKWSSIDIRVSELFYDATKGIWPMASSTAFELFRMSLWYMADGSFLACFALLCLRIVSPLFRRVRWESLGFYILTYAVGPGLLVNVYLKEFWGRARPNQILQFGGNKFFTPALEMTSQCQHNCSFVAGEGSAFACISISLFFIMKPRLEKLNVRVMLAVIFVLAIVGSMMRVGFGGHFFSDVVFSWLLMALVVGLMDWIFRLFHLDYKVRPEHCLSR
ncbi:hypothetical protein B6V73_09820 [Thioclava sp. JM3]|uniref:phosphatase PAP2 family protein n=1 Tax=Thioclava sp. JM3 TaxID=1973004 RepID=UPI000B53A977|nr:phosphatase PAP2 family protein [Thioclava sp. JM3]OWY17127.1 hypothetical protein B6V73_09820 [Thioclava sp. JM3]